MKKENFISSLMELTPGCTKETAKIWTQFATDNVVLSKQFVDFAEENPNGDGAAIEDWLDSIYAGIGLIQQRFNEDIALQIVNLGTLPFCLYPYEMFAAAQHFANGGKPEKIPELNEEGLLDSTDEDNWPTFPKIEMLSGNANCEESTGITMQ